MELIADYIYLIQVWQTVLKWSVADFTKMATTISFILCSSYNEISIIFPIKRKSILWCFNQQSTAEVTSEARS